MIESSADILRRAYPKVLARTLAFTRSLPEAEDAAQEAVVRALSRWPEHGVPHSPEAWLLTVAKNCHRDRLRRAGWEAPQHDALESLAQLSPWVQSAMGEPSVAGGWKDELLRVVFACCHPALRAGESAALCLATVVGFSTNEVAAAFVVKPRTMEQRLARARSRLRAKGDAEGASPERSGERIDAALQVLHLLYNEGYWSSGAGAPIRGELCRLALGLAHSLRDAFPEHGEAGGLLALLLFHESRRPARLDAGGNPVPLPEQDRSRWDREAVAAATSLLQHTTDSPGAFGIEAAISAAHCHTATSADTDWDHIARLYARLEQLRPSAAVRVNRAFALARAEGPRVGLALLEADSEATAAYPYIHLVRGTLLAECGQPEAARAELTRARELARNDVERRQIEARIEALAGGD